MNYERSLIACIVAGALQIASLASSAELIVNGGFETGDFTGWTATTNADGFAITELTPWAVATAGNGYFFDSSPLEGSFDALNGFDGDAGLVYELYQDVSIPAGTTAQLTTNHRIVFDGLGIPSTMDRVFEVSIRDTDGVLIEELYSESVTLNGATTTDLGWQQEVFDVSSYAGSTVRVHFRESIPESYTGPANIELDAISLVAVPEPATSAFMLAGLATCSCGRRIWQ